MKSSIISYCNLDRKNEADGILQDRFHLFYPVYISMCRSYLIVSVFGNCGPFIFMGKVVIYFIQKILLAFKIFKILPGNKIVQKICLEIAQKESSGAHNVKSPQRNTAFDASQGNVQVYLCYFEYQRSHTVIICGSVVDSAGEL